MRCDLQVHTKDVPLAITGRYAIENVFAHLGMARYLHARKGKSVSATIVEVTA
jgi:hypothetical protein